jgi:hypothetical protein
MGKAVVEIALPIFIYLNYDKYVHDDEVFEICYGTIADGVSC